MPSETMDATDNRQIARDSLFLMADLRIEGFDGMQRIKVRNLSAGGMMGEGSVRVIRGARVEVNLRNAGWVAGTVAWVHESRFGVAFLRDIDPSVVRVPVGDGERAPAYTRAPTEPERPKHPLRKV
jgi:hypothetical protein